MKNIIVAVFLSLCLQFTFFARADECRHSVIAFPVVETPKNKYREAAIIEPGVIVYPSEVYFGDSIFILHTAKNLGTNECATMAVPGTFDFQYDGLDYTFTAEGIDEKYNPMWESPFLMHADYFYPQIFLEPTEAGITSGIELELPPLEDWDVPFWKAVRDNLPPEGRKVTLTFSHRTGKDQRSDLGFVEILIKPRPAMEMDKLQAWFDSMNKESLPVEQNLLYGYPVKGPRDSKEIPQIPLSQRKEQSVTTTTERKSGTIQLGNQSYLISSIIRFSHRKPPRMQAPITLEDWRNLRDSFSPSSIRTELEWIVLKMEYLDAYQSANPKPQLDKRDEIVKWIQSQPDFMQSWWAKRTQSVATLKAGPLVHEALDDERNERGVEFLRVLYPMLDSINQKDLRYFIPEMRAEDEKRIDDGEISKGISEQEKSDGVRFWFLETGKLLCKGKLIAIGKTQAIFKEDYGRTYISTIETLSQEDRQYIQEKRNDSQWSPDMDDRFVREFLDKENVSELAETKKNNVQEPIAKGKKLRVYTSAGGDVYSVTYSPDGSRLLTSGKDQTAKLWNAQTGELMQTFSGHHSAVKSTCISPDGRYLLTGADQDRTARLWDMQTGKEIRKIPISHWNHNQTMFSPDGQYFFTTVDTRSITMFSVETGENLMQFRGHGNYVRSIAISPDGLRLLTGSEDKTAKLWDIDSGRTLWTAKLDGSVTAVAFTPDGKYVITGAYDRGIHLLDAQTGDVVKNIASKYSGHSYSFALSPDGKELICTDFQRMIQVYSIPEGKFLRGFRGHDLTITDVSVSPDGKQFATCGMDGNVKIWDINTSQFEDEYSPPQNTDSDTLPEVLSPLININAAHHGVIENVQLSPDGTLVLFADGMIPRVLNAVNGEEVFRSEKASRTRVPAMAFTPDGKNIFIYHTFYDTSTWTPGNHYSIDQYNHRSPFYSIAFSKDKKHFVAGDMLPRAHLFNFESEKEIRQFKISGKGHGGHEGESLFYITFLANETEILAVMRTGDTYVWDAASGIMAKPFTKIEQGGNSVFSAAHSRDEKYIVFCHYGIKTVFLRDLKTGQLVKMFNGHDDMVLDVAFSPDSQFMLTGSADKTARLWEVESGKCVKVLEGHTAPVCSVTFSSDGRQFLTGSEDGTAILWE